ncbi:MAG: site-specific tyrosine recombinase XerC [Acidobacteria bacterium]|nr:site-specific tyrosine recombinase XerC [Acidobacteriota bacterium]
MTKNQRPYADPNDTESLIVLKDAYIVWQQTVNYAPDTSKRFNSIMWNFITWCHARGITQPIEVNRQVLESYQRHLFHAKSKRDGGPLKRATQSGMLVHIKGFFRWLNKKNYIPYNPAADLELPKREYNIPRVILTPLEMEKVMSIPDVENPFGLRDRAAMELLYSTGIRRFEACRLKIYDLLPEQGTLTVRQGKNKKDRVVPIGDRALDWIDKYMLEVRAQWAPDLDVGFLFLQKNGEPIKPELMSCRLRKYLVRAGITQPGACHVFRHSMATAMLERGADLRCIQEILGHAKLETTQIYTHVSIRRLKEVHRKNHPVG